MARVLKRVGGGLLAVLLLIAIPWVWHLVDGKSARGLRIAGQPLAPTSELQRHLALYRRPEGPVAAGAGR